MVNHIGGGGRSGFNTLVTVILLSCGLVRQVLHFKIENTPMKDTNGKRKFKRILSFLFVDKRELFAMKLSFVEFNPVFFTADQSTWLVLNQTKCAFEIDFLPCAQPI